MNCSTRISSLRTNLLHVEDHLKSLKLNESFLGAVCNKPEANQATKDKHVKLKTKIDEYTKLIDDINRKNY